MKRTLRDAFDRWKDALIMRGVMSQDYHACWREPMNITAIRYSA